jgi:hypothetical protein
MTNISVFGPHERVSGSAISEAIPLLHVNQAKVLPIVRASATKIDAMRENEHFTTGT